MKFIERFRHVSTKIELLGGAKDLAWVPAKSSTNFVAEENKMSDKINITLNEAKSLIKEANKEIDSIINSLEYRIQTEVVINVVTEIGRNDRVNLKAVL